MGLTSSAGAGFVDSERELELDFLREATRGFLGRNWSPETVRAGLETPRVLDRDLWRRSTELGWIAAAIPAEHGGLRDDALDLAVIVEEIGRSLYGGPYLGSMLAAAVVAGVQEDAAVELSAALDSGTSTAAWCVAEANGRWDRDAIGLLAHETSTGYALNGQKCFVIDADLADALVVSALTAQGVANWIVPTDARGVSVETPAGLDLTRRIGVVTFDETPAGPPVATGAAAEAAIDRGLALGALLTTADSVGCGERLLELTLEYTLGRVTFGKPLASYQAIKHKCADMLFWLESSRVAVRQAGLSGDTAALVHGAAIAKSVGADACSRLAGESLQIHGGIGFTWEHDLHLYLRRIKANEVLFGDIAAHRHRLGPQLT